MQKALITTVMMTAVMACPGLARAGTVTELKVTESKPLPGVHQINFMSFDVNKDGHLSMREVGDVLFTAFDGDRNGLVDNLEYDRNSVMTVIPTEETTYTFYDYDSNGMTDAKTISRDEFIERSNLMRFDKQYDGLSPKDFLSKGMKEVDLNHDNFLDKEEWEREYALIVKPKAALQKIYND